MAAPRVFVSSTFYDLRQIRADLELFIREMGYEPILHERGGVAYGSREKLEEYAYKEVDLADLLIAIMGGRFGTQSQHGGRSISHEELRRALANDTQVYIFVEQSVLTEYQTYLTNKGNGEVKWRYVDDPRVYEYLEDMYALPQNNTIQSFETAADITGFLKRQWAGLFHRFLQEQSKQREFRTLEEMQATARTLDRLVDFLSVERQSPEDAIRDILQADHPLFAHLRALLNIRYPIFFRDIDEMHRWLVDAAGFRRVPASHLDDDEHDEWYRGTKYLKVFRGLFDERGRIVPMRHEDYDPSWLRLLSVDPGLVGLVDAISEEERPDGPERRPKTRRSAARRRRPRTGNGDDD